MDESYDDLLRSEDTTSKDAKFNMFRFQDHLLRIIGIIAECFYKRDYPSAFEELQNLYADTNGFFDKEEKDELDKLYKTAHTANTTYVNYNINYQVISTNVRNQVYNPPSNLYDALLKFRFRLMDLLCKHQLLIPQIKKGQSGAASG